MWNWLLLALTICGLAGCVVSSDYGPKSVQESSITRPELRDRINFLETYVTFRRRYHKLEYDIFYQNNGEGRVPGPSDWDLRIRAVIPSVELSDWIPEGEPIESPPPEWLKTIPGTIPIQEITEWYRDVGIEVGIDRTNSIIAYRNTTVSD